MKMVAKRQYDLEGDLFPRGTSRSATPRVQKRNGQTLFGPQLKRPRVSRQVQALSESSVLQHGASLSTSRLSVGMTLLGLITKADRAAIELVLPGGLRGTVASHEFLLEQSPGSLNMHDTDHESSSDTSDDEIDSIRPVWEVVNVGDITPAAIVDVAVNQQGKKIAKLSLKPHLVNVGLNPDYFLAKDFSAYGAIKSVEDHGYVISFGANIPHTAFLPFGKSPASYERKLWPGTPITVVTVHNVKLPQEHMKSVSSSVRVSARRSDVLKAVVDAEGLTYQDLQAGMLLRSRVLQEGRGGVSLSALGIFSLDVDASHVPRKSDGSFDVKTGKHVLARLLYVDPTQKRIGASLLDSFVDKLSPRPVSPLWKTGTRLKALQVERVEPGFGLLLRHIHQDLDKGDESEDFTMHRDENTSNEYDPKDNVPVFAHISRISDSKGLKLESRYRRHDIIRDGARVVSVSRFDGVINVDLRPSVLLRKALSLDEVEVGEVYDCKILSHTTMGSLMVAVDGDPYLPGIILPAHISDVPIPSKRLTKNPAFRIGASIKCRAISVQTGKGRVLLTARKSLVTSKFPILTSYDQAVDALKHRAVSTKFTDEGECPRFTGITKELTQRGSLLVGFCNRVVGLVPAAELCVDPTKQSSRSEIESLYPVGGTVHVRLLKVDPKKRRMLLSMSLEPQPEELTRRRVFKTGQRVKATISAVDMDSRQFLVVASPIQVESREENGVSLDGAEKSECYLPFGHLSDNIGVAEGLVSELQLRIKGLLQDKRSSDLEIPEAMVLCYRDDVAVLTVKTSLLIAEGSGCLPKCFDDIRLTNATKRKAEKGFSVLRGYVKALLPSGAIIGFLGECVGFIRNSRVADRFVSDPARFLKMHQSISAIVESIDESNRRFHLSMRPSDVGRTGIEADTLSLFASLESWQSSLGVPCMDREFPLGRVVTASVRSVSAYGVKYDLKSQNRAAVGVAYGFTADSADVIMTDAGVEAREPASPTYASDSKSKPKLTPSTVERVRILDVDPITSVVDLSRDEKVISQGDKKSVISPGASFEATVVLVKSAYFILAVKRSKSRTAIAYALGPVSRENLLIRPGAEVKCLVLDKKQAKTSRNLVLVDWESFRSTEKEVRLSSTRKSSECARTISILQASGTVDESSLIGKKIAGKVTRKFRLHAYLGIAPGVVGQVHITNTSFLTAEEVSNIPLGIAPPVIGSQYVLPELGKTIKVAYFAGLRRASDTESFDPIAAEVSLCKERCSLRAPCAGEKVIGFVKRPSSRLEGLKQSERKQEAFTQTLIAISPTNLISCADVDCLFNDNVTLEEGTPVICQIIGLADDEIGHAKGIISCNGEERNEGFLGLVQSVHPGRGLRVSIPWYARDLRAKSVTWGYVNICDVADNFEETVNVLNELQPGSVVKVYAVSTTRDVESEEKYRVWLSMRATGQSDAKDPLLTKDNLDNLEDGSSVRGFVQGVGKKGCFVSIGRNIIAQVRLCDLSDEFVKDPKTDFPAGKLVSGLAYKSKVPKQERRVSLVLRKRPRKELRTLSLPSELKEGSTVRGIVRRVAEYGALVEIAPGLKALLHKSEADQDRYIKDPREEWVVGQKLTAIVIRLGEGKINIGTKRCYFEAAGADEASIDEMLEKNLESKIEIKKDGDVAFVGEKRENVTVSIRGHGREIDLSDDSRANKEASSNSLKCNDACPRVDSLSSTQELDFFDSLMRGRKASPLEVSGGFDFAEALVQKLDNAVDTDDEPREQNNRLTNLEDQSNNSSRNKREKKRLRDAAERAIRLREEALATNPNAPETAEDFERLLLGDPNSSVMWIRYMAFCVQLSQIDKARSVAERALETISLHSEQERVNVWCAYINLEAQFGSMNAAELETNDARVSKKAAAVFRVFERACERITDVKDFHLQVFSALRRSFPELADEVLRRGVRRFKDSKDVWIAFGKSQFTKGDIECARKTLERALMAVDKREHVPLITKFAQFEYRYGNAERGRTVFESLIGNFPKRVDLWNIYLDMEMSQCLQTGAESKDDFVKRTRKLLERFSSLELTSKKMKFAFKKWLRFEKTFGTKENESEVKRRARTYVEKNVRDAHSN